MKNNTLIRNIAVLLVVALVCVMTGQIYLKQLKNDTFYTANPNITKVLHLSDYNPNLKGTANDVEVYVFDSGVPGTSYFRLSSAGQRRARSLSRRTCLHQ